MKELNRKQIEYLYKLLRKLDEHSLMLVHISEDFEDDNENLAVKVDEVWGLIFKAKKKLKKLLDDSEKKLSFALPVKK